MEQSEKAQSNLLLSNLLGEVADYSTDWNTVTKAYLGLLKTYNTLFKDCSINHYLMAWFGNAVRTNDLNLAFASLVLHVKWLKSYLENKCSGEPK